MTATFDPATYKDTTRAQWEEAAAAWHAWGPTLEDWLGEATTLMLDAAGIHTGSAVLDVAAGAGGQSLAAARRVGPAGEVLATDISPAILRLRGRRGRRRRPRHRAHPRARRRAARRRTRRVRRGDLPPRAHLLPRPAACAGRHVPGAAARRPGRRHRLLHPRPQQLLLHPGRHRPSAGPAGRRPRPANPDRSASARPGVLARLLRQAGFRDVGTQLLPPRCGCRAPPTASASSASPPAHCTRCSPASPPPNATRPGRKSTPSCPDSSDPTASEAPAS